MNMNLFRVPVLVILLLFINSVFCKSDKIDIFEREKQILDQILSPDRYDPRIRPSGNNGSDAGAVVRVNIFVRSITKVDDINMEYSVQLTFREQWHDERLKFNDFGGRIRYLTLTETDKMWMPDLFFCNEKESHFHNAIKPNVYIRIFPLGSVLYSTRISMTLSCPMDLKPYPHDRQICTMRMASYGWSTDDLIFIWKEGDPVQIGKNIQLPRFTLKKFVTNYCDRKISIGEYSCLKVDFLFKRDLSYYLIQIYIPCCMLVIVSWISFWLDQRAVSARVSLSMITLLAMGIHISSVNATLPTVSYIKAIDIWTGVCMTFVFGALLEFALVNYASRVDMRRNMEKKRREQENAQSADLPIIDTDSNKQFSIKPLVGRLGDPSTIMEVVYQHQTHMQPPRSKCYEKVCPFKFSMFSKRIDIISRITFPLLFALFNVVYWMIYVFPGMTKED